ncbi:MAG: flagellar basal body-associated FliL family protein [Terriglobales bacterium]
MGSLLLLPLVLFPGCSVLHRGSKVEAAAVKLRILPLSSSVYNLADATPAYLRLGLSLALASPAGTDDTTLKSVASDTLVSLVTAQTSTVLLTHAGKEALKQAVLAAIQKRLPGAGVKALYFDQFLVQR